MEKIYVQLFRNFSITFRDEDILRHLNRWAKCTAVLKYLILNQNKAIPAAHLLELFWNDEAGVNPENALRKLISRVRQAFADVDERLKHCIVTKKGTYRWMPCLPCETDTVTFTELCRELLTPQASQQADRSQYAAAFSLYKGDIDLLHASDECLRGKSLYFHNLYLKVVARYVEHLKKEEDYEELIYVCRTALSIDPFEEQISLALMEALRKTKRSREALEQYRHTTELTRRHVGLEPTDKMLAFYKRLLQSDLEMKENLYVILKRLTAGNAAEMAYVCDYAIFRDIFQLQINSFHRCGARVYLGLVMVEGLSGDGLDPLVQDSAMSRLLDVILGVLQEGDVVTRYNSFQYAVLLMAGSDKGSETVLDCINRDFYKEKGNANVKLQFRITPVRGPGDDAVAG